MRVTEITEIAAPPQEVWAVMADVVGWPEWTASVTSVELLEGDAVAVGTRARVRQPGFPAADWTVTEVDEGRSFTWVSRAPGVVSTGTHSVRPSGAGATVTLGFTQEGLLAPLLRLLAGRRSRRYVRMEADGLRARCERAHGPERTPGSLSA